MNKDEIHAELSRLEAEQTRLSNELDAKHAEVRARIVPIEKRRAELHLELEIADMPPEKRQALKALL